MFYPTLLLFKCELTPCRQFWLLGSAPTLSAPWHLGKGHARIASVKCKRSLLDVRQMATWLSRMNLEHLSGSEIWAVIFDRLVWKCGEDGQIVIGCMVHVRYQIHRRLLQPIDKRERGALCKQERRWLQRKNSQMDFCETHRLEESHRNHRGALCCFQRRDSGWKVWIW